MGGEELVDVALDDGRLARAEFADDQDLVEVLELVADLGVKLVVRMERAYPAVCDTASVR